ncbi:MAG TPA: alpha/beta hydrolase family protein [Gemmatimonadaceae bacterium]|nr:alpha/beta hydrolase family protein [Gemmatimonadaceae bacterium]
MRRLLVAAALALLAPGSAGAAGGQGGVAVAAAGTLDTLTFWSQSLGTHKRALVWLPPGYAREPQRRYPTAYYLHGLWGSETDWTTQGRLHVALDSLTAGGLPEMIVVMPDGDDGWYTTWNTLVDVASCRRGFTARPGDEVDASYCVPWPHYDDYIARDLVSAVDGQYRTVPSRARRAIAGLSMGGFGALSMALQYPDVFRAAASHSGVVSPLYDGPHPFDGTPRYAATDSAIREAWGERFWPIVAPVFGYDLAGWTARDPFRRVQQLLAKNPSLVPAIFLDCGTEDGLVDQNRALRAELTRIGRPPRYAEWPGKHDWPYWRVHARESLAWLAQQVTSGR